MMQLFYSEASPYARMVRILVCEFALLDRVNFVRVHPFDNPPALLAANPLGKVPVLVTEHDVLCDSALICDYLLTFAKRDASEILNWSSRRRRALAVGMIDVAVAWRQDRMRPQSQQSDFWQTRYRTALARTLNVIANEMQQTPWPAFPAMESVALLCALEYLSFRHPDFSIAFDVLTNWKAGMDNRTSVIETRPCD